MTLDVKNDLNKHQGSSLQNFRPFDAQEMHILLIVSSVPSKFEALRCTGSAHSPYSLQSVLHGVLDDILDS